jgi:hypothetical protein
MPDKIGQAKYGSYILISTYESIVLRAAELFSGNIVKMRGMNKD